MDVVISLVEFDDDRVLQAGLGCGPGLAFSSFVLVTVSLLSLAVLVFTGCGVISLLESFAPSDLLPEDGNLDDSDDFMLPLLPNSSLKDISGPPVDSEAPEQFRSFLSVGGSCFFTTYFTSTDAF